MNEILSLTTLAVFAWAIWQLMRVLEAWERRRRGNRRAFHFPRRQPKRFAGWCPKCGGATLDTGTEVHCHRAPHLCDYER